MRSIVAVEAVNYVIPLTYIVESLQARSDDVRGLGGEDNAMIRVRGEYLPLFSLHELLRIGGEAPAPEQGIVVIDQGDEHGDLRSRPGDYTSAIPAWSHRLGRNTSATSTPSAPRENRERRPQRPSARTSAGRPAAG